MTALPLALPTPILHCWLFVLAFTVVFSLFGDLLPDRLQEMACAASAIACLFVVGLVIMWCAQ